LAESSETLVAIAFIFGLAFASTLNLPKQSGAAETLAIPPPRPRPSMRRRPSKAAGDFQTRSSPWRSM